ncbi:MAG: hypothetical protein M9950_00835 [Thermomicrobiales bacterium]|nr:hypothetical protein [Thermomicrobiales bacterium]
MEPLAQLFTDNIDWLVSRRWFGDKARSIVAIDVETADLVRCGDTAVILVVIRCEFEWGRPSRYFVPLLAGDNPLPERDATTNADFLEWLVTGFEHEREVSDRWRWRVIGDAFPATEGVDYTRAKAISGEQSNTTVVYDNAFIGKIFRKISAGANPDLEIGEHFMHVRAFEHVPALYGVIELTQGDDRIDVLAVQEYVPNVGDGWSWLLRMLADAEHRDHLISDIALLGTRTAEMHLALADDLGNPDFTPIEIDEAQAQAIIQRVIAEIEGSVEGLTHVLDPSQVERLHKGLGLMMGDAWSMVGTQLIRVHGDYHLGQTLRTDRDDFAIIDFEGEPSRTMDERRLKLPALKDVAGMVRSLDYAGATLAQQTDDADEKKAFADWVARASDAFVNSYKTAIASATIPLVPADDAAFTSVLNLMIAEKALYETRYELNNRPDWLWIPLGALLRLVRMEED